MDGLLRIPPGIDVDKSYSTFLRSTNKIGAVLKISSSTFFYQDLLSNPRIWTKSSALRRLAGYVASAHLTQEWVESWFKERSVVDDDVVFYTYWFDSATLGVGLARRKFPRLKLVSRAHGYDLYEDRYPVPYLPCRSQAFKVTDAVFPDSYAGEAYLKKRYPNFQDKFETALLGVEEGREESPASHDGIFRIASCAVIRPVKRIDLILDGLKYAAEIRPAQRFEWHHFGNGELPGVRESMQKRADETLPLNARAYFPGYSSQPKLYDFYCENPVDVFVNTSESEGTPVSIMEAISCGIPVIATAVGGNREIVTSQNGLLLGEDPKPEDVAQALFWYIDHPVEAQAKRTGSRLLWQERYNARRNFEVFADRLITIRSME